MKSRYMAQVQIGSGRPALHVAAVNQDWALDTAQAKAAELAAQKPGQQVDVHLFRWERGLWQWLDSRSHLVLQALPEDAVNDYFTGIESDRTN